MKKLSKKAVLGIVGGAAGLAAVSLTGILALRVDPARAQSIALGQTGGGQIISQEIENEGLWNEYKYEIVNGDNWYQVELNGFGGLEELEYETRWHRD